MKFVIPQNNLKIFAKSILTLSKIGDELYFEPTSDALSIRTINSSRSAFTCFSFKQSFFSFFEPNLLSKNHLNTTNLNTTNLNNTTVNDGNTSRRFNDQDDDDVIEDLEPFKCKIPVKCFLSIFKNINSLEKNIEKCTITVKYIPLTNDTAQKVYDYDSTMVTKKINKNNQEQLFDTKFLIIMTSKHGLRKTFILSISDCEKLQTSFLITNCSNKLSISSKYLHETMNSFSNDTDEVTFLVEPNKLMIKNYVIPENTDIKSLINTQVSFDTDEFNHYEIDKEFETITFCLKEFKVCLQFGFWFEMPLDIYFKHKGRPIIFAYSSSNFEANFTFATLSDDSSISQCTNISSHSATNRTSQFNKTNKSFDQSNIVEIMDQSLNGSNLQKNKSSNKNDTRPNISNKRTLYDASNNQVYLNNDQSIGNLKMDNENEDDDTLLSQALDAHQEKTKNKTCFQMANNSKSIQIPPTPSPPAAKKMKSLVQTLFDDGEENEEEIREEKKPKARQSLAMFLNETNDSMEVEEDTREDRKKCIYVENTDSEDD
ncbi:unnamed protein product [Brachionus calyciflorus]|uniref:Cell cycle checkpoint control protein RAD9A n=1 Tax=Brachionus calyciflorus TaxID=104777 RepID=A0A813SRE8_9BILA|nr:unnamed protein product [Brachionus calyciflorus]